MPRKRKNVLARRWPRNGNRCLRGVQENVTELVLLTASKLSQKELDQESDRKLVDSFLSETDGDKL